MSATAGQPAVAGTVISSATFNSLVADLIAELTDSLSRSGKGNMSAALRTPDGTVAAPAHSFTSETGDGMYRAGAGDLRLSVSGVDALQLGAGGVSGSLNLIAAGQGNLSATASNAGLQLSGNRAAADGNPDVYIQGVATRTAGYVASFRHGGGDKLLVDFQGLLRLASQAAPLQPGSMVTAITPDTNVAAAGGLGYFKDVSGVVRLRGSLTNNTGGVATNLVSTSPLAAGFRPLGAARAFACAANNSTTIYLNVLTNGGIATAFGSTIPNGVTVFVDSISFVAEQ